MDVIPNFLETGKFSPKPSIHTISNAMDVGNPSNIVRIMDLYQTIEKLKMDMISWSFNEIETSNLIKEFFIEKKYLLDPHTDTIINLDIKTSRWPQGKQKILSLIHI